MSHPYMCFNAAKCVLQAKAKKPLFVQFVLENLWTVYEAIMVQRWAAYMYTALLASSQHVHVYTLILCSTFSETSRKLTKLWPALVWRSYLVTLVTLILESTWPQCAASGFPWPLLCWAWWPAISPVLTSSPRSGWRDSCAAQQRHLTHSQCRPEN